VQTSFSTISMEDPAFTEPLLLFVTVHGKAWENTLSLTALMSPDLESQDAKGLYGFYMFPNLA
jgi:hypothetical protein